MTITDKQIHEDLHRAYIDARKHKMSTLAHLEFEEVQEKNLEELYQDLIQRKYIPKPAFCFITYDPVQREVYASQFPDRVVQHMLYNYLAPFFERLFIHDTYSCRKGKGTHYGVKRFRHHIRSITDNYKKTAWVLVVDLSGYFMSIDKSLLIDTIMTELYKHEHTISDDRIHTWGERIDFEFCRYLLHCFLDRNPAEGRIKLGNPHNWDGLPKNKSLDNSPEGIGIVIGDIISQLFSNIILNITDQWAKRERKLKHYGHYVDDHYVMSRSRNFLERLKHEMERVFWERAHVKLHPTKCKIYRADQAIQYLGAYIRKGYMLPRQRTVNKFSVIIQELEYDLIFHKPTFETLMQTMARINSYCGIFRHTKSYRMRRHYLDRAAFLKYYEFDEYFTKCKIRKEYVNILKNKSWY